MEDGQNFIKISPSLSFIKAYRMDLISVGSISLDSTFKLEFGHVTLTIHVVNCSVM
jgi:hypothetical protein